MDMLQGLAKVFPQQFITIEEAIAKFPTKKLDQNGFSIEKVY